MATVYEFAAQLEADLERGYIKRYGDKYPELAKASSRVTVHEGPKYTRVNVERSGRYMVVNATGEIFGIKAYGVIHRGHQYGTLATIQAWDWSGYTATPAVEAVGQWS